VLINRCRLGRRTWVLSAATLQMSKLQKMARGSGMTSEAAGICDLKAHIHEKHKHPSFTPWLDEVGEPIWHGNRKMVAKLVLGRRFEIIMGAVIAANFCLIVFEADRDGSCYPEYANKFLDCPTASSQVKELWYMNMAFLLTYSVEALLRGYAFRRLYFYDKWNYLDLFIVFAGWLQEVLGSQSNLAMLRVFRLARLFRSFRIFNRIRELYLLIRGFASSIKAIFFGMIMLFSMLVGFSVLMVELVHPVNSQMVYTSCPDCSDAFRSVFWSTLTLFKEIIAGGSWIISSSVIERSPALCIVLVMAVAVISLGTMNLILSVIVERAGEARDRDIADRIQQKDEEAGQVKLQLLKVCAAMDTDCSYNLSVEELRAAYDKLPDFRNFIKLMSVGRKDLDMVFELLDSDCNGSVDYKEFCDELYLLSLTDQRWALADAKHKLSAMKRSIDNKLEEMLSRFDARAESQDQLLNEIVLQLNTLMPRPGMQAQPIISPKCDPRAPLLSTTSTSTSLGDSTDDACMRQDPDLDISRLISQTTIETLREHLQQITSVHQRITIELEEQVAAVQRQSEFIAHVCGSISCIRTISQHGCPEKVNGHSPGDQLDRGGIYLDHVFKAVQCDAAQLGFSIDRVGDLMVWLGKASKVAGVEAFPAESMIRHRITCM